MLLFELKESGAMDMQLDKCKLRKARTNRAWSQEQLAEISGLSDRTIRRAESKGAVSFESAKALASALELELSYFVLSDIESVHVESKKDGIWWLIGGALILVVLVFSWVSSKSSDMGLQVELTTSTGKQYYMASLVKSGTRSVLISDELELELKVLAVRGNALRMEAALYDLSKSSKSVLARPVFSFSPDQPATIKGPNMTLLLSLVSEI